MLRGLIEALTPREPTTHLRVGSSSPVEVPISTFHIYSFVQPDRNIAEAQKNGILPLNFHDLRSQISDSQLHESVLFDTPPSGGVWPGNHWRILSTNDTHNIVEIQLCGGAFGNHDAPIPPFTVSQYDILFTGIATMSYLKGGHRLSLAEATEAFKNAGYGTGTFDDPKDITWIGETIYFADQNGKLIPYDQHPLFSQIT